MDQNNGGELPPEQKPPVYPDDPESTLPPEVEPPMPRALNPEGASGGTTSTPPPPSGSGSSDNDDEDDGEEGGMLRMSFMEHLDELRARLIRILVGFGVAFLECLIFAPPLW